MDNQSDLFVDATQQTFVDEIKRLKDLNQRLMAGAQELRDALDVVEFDDAWSKLFKLFKEST
jgi:hypothetical protein